MVSAIAAPAIVIHRPRRMRSGDASPLIPTTKTCIHAAIVIAGQPATLTARAEAGNASHTQSVYTTNQIHTDTPKTVTATAGTEVG
ncbi:Uncharacterised protein [Mycobacteroides abscessus subsp. massiliense]|nr:Uncharacterised protein [Mycobacteroides abscessus subsp. massiliense]